MISFKMPAITVKQSHYPELIDITTSSFDGEGRPNGGGISINKKQKKELIEMLKNMD